MSQKNSIAEVIERLNENEDQALWKCLTTDLNAHTEALNTLAGRRTSTVDDARALFRRFALTIQMVSANEVRGHASSFAGGRTETPPNAGLGGAKPGEDHADRIPRQAHSGAKT